MRARVLAVCLGVLLAVWSAGFACAHVAWALGWRAGVPRDQPPISHRPVFLTYDLVAAAFMFGAAVVAVALVSAPLRPRTRWRLLRVTRVGAVLALLRGVPALALDAITRDVTAVGLFADVWFVVAGLAGVALARQSARDSDQGPAAARANAASRSMS